MEVYKLDSLLRRERVIDRFESLIWTERYKDYGDFEMVIRSTNESRSLLTPGTKLAMSASYRGMTVETVEDATDEEGRKMLLVKGPSFEKILEERAAMESKTALSWELIGLPAVIARKIFHDVCVTGVLDTKDIIPFVIEGSIMPDDNIPEPVDPIKIDLAPKSVGQAIKEICDVWNLGFRLLRNFDASELYFDIYAGSDRTAGQTELPPVIFSQGLDNLKNTKELTTIEGSKNVAYVFSPAGFLEVLAPNIDPDTEGFERRILVVDANDITTEDPEDAAAALLQRGKEELAKFRPFQAFDGEISQNSQYVYGVDYNLGDLVEQRSESGVSNQMRVTEQIFVSDKEGERAYPTLELNTFVSTGSWLQQGTLVWHDYYDDPVTWSEMP